MTRRTTRATPLVLAAADPERVALAALGVLAATGLQRRLGGFVAPAAVRHGTNSVSSVLTRRRGEGALAEGSVFWSDLIIADRASQEVVSTGE